MRLVYATLPVVDLNTSVIVPARLTKSRLIFHL